MRFKVELVYINPNDESKNISHTTFLEASGKEEAISIAKENQLTERPDLRPTDRWFWFAYETEESSR